MIVATHVSGTFDGVGLLVVERRPRLRRRRVRHCGHGEAFGQPALRQRPGGGAPVVDGEVQHILVDAGCVDRFAQSVGQQARATAQAGQSGAAGLGQPPRPGVGVGQRIAMAQRDRQRGRQHLAGRRMGVADQPVQRGPQLVGQQRDSVQRGLGDLQFAGDGGIGIADRNTVAGVVRAHQGWQDAIRAGVPGAREFRLMIGSSFGVHDEALGEPTPSFTLIGTSSPAREASRQRFGRDEGSHAR